MRLSPRELRRRAGRVRLFLMDVDGVLTGGHLYHFVDRRGRLVELKGVHTQDSISLVWLAESGIKTGFISGRRSEGIAERARHLKVSYVYQERLDKRTVFDEIRRDCGLAASETLFLGDDLPDIQVLGAAGLGVAVANARPEVKARAHWVTRAAGGEGAVREAAELVLKARGSWAGLLDRYGARSRGKLT